MVDKQAEEKRRPAHRWWVTVMVVLLIGVIHVSSSAAAGKQVAFVVGIETYDKLPVHQQLKNAVHDAEGVSAELTKIGFTVMGKPNLSRSAFNAQWQDVLDTLTEEDTFLLYFSGHGVQIDGQNYLLPRDIPYIQYGRQLQLTREAISLNQLLADLTMGDRPHPKRSVVILDACRDNPLVPPGYKGGNTRGGLANVDASNGLFVMYSAANNRTALDRLSPEDPVPYSVFTRVLLPLLGRQDLTIQELSTTVKNRVWGLAKNAGHEQQPVYYDGILGRFCLAGCAPVPPITFQEEIIPPGPPPIPEKETIPPVPPPQPSTVLSQTITGKDGAPMVLVAAGEFTMGAREDDKDAQADERPAHQVYLDAYYIDQFEVTTSHYAAFMEATKRDPPQHWPENVLKVHGKKPVVGVTWDDAQAYCGWAGKRLPTEAEWEKAARGTDGRVYPWGQEPPNEKLANFNHCCDFKDYGVLTDVGSFKRGKSPYGAYDLAGNVWEWVVDWYDETLYQQRAKGNDPIRNPGGPEKGEFKVLRGGSWSTEAWFLRSSGRIGDYPSLRNSYDGFRCVQGAP